MGGYCKILFQKKLERTFPIHNPNAKNNVASTYLKKSYFEIWEMHTRNPNPQLWNINCGMRSWKGGL